MSEIGWIKLLFDIRTFPDALLGKKGQRVKPGLGDEFFNAYSIEFEKHFVIGGETKRAGGPFKMTWAFIAEPIGQDATRLITRARMTSSPKWAEYAMGKILYPPIHGLMSRAQLGTIKELAKRDAQSRMPDQVILSRG